jgi:hypothetical protein
LGGAEFLIQLPIECVNAWPLKNKSKEKQKKVKGKS